MTTNPEPTEDDTGADIAAQRAAAEARVEADHARIQEEQARLREERDRLDGSLTDSARAVPARLGDARE